LERLAAEISTRLIRCPAAGIGECIEEVLAQIGKLLDLDSVALRLLDETTDSLILTHRWSPGTGKPQFPIGHSLSKDEIPWLYQQMKNRRILHVQSLADIPPEARMDRDVFQFVGATGMMLLVPLFDKDTTTGYLNIQTRRKNRQLSSSDDALLRFIGSSLSSGLERERAEKVIEQRLSFERLAAEILAGLIDCPVARIDEHIRESLAQVGNFLKLDGVAVRLLNKTGDCMILTHRWLSDTAKPNFPIGHSLPVSETPWLYAQVRKGGTVRVDDPVDIPPEAQKERELFQFEGTTSSMLVPLGSAASPMGYLYIQVRQENRQLSSADDALLRFIGSSISRGVERKRTEQMLEQTIEERTRELAASLEHMEELNTVLTQASTARDRFLSVMSHELRTPMSAVLGYAEMLGGRYFGDLNDKQEEYVAAIATSGNRLMQVLDNLLEVSRIDAGAAVLHPEAIAIQDLLEAPVAMLRVQAEKRGVELVVEPTPDLPMLMCDRQRANQILLNLLDNALKYTAEGGRVTLRARREDAHARIEVSDTGIGITPEHQTTIFEEFEQADRMRDEALGGIGMGLPLCRRLARLHGGQIGLESTVGAGSTFWFTLPLAEDAPVAMSGAQPVAGAADPSVTPADLLILVAEDNETNRGMILDMLEVLGVRGLGVPNGLAALEMAQKMRPDLILMDVRMPVMDGLEATRRIRALRECAEIPIVALTANAEPEQQTQCRAAGCLGFLSKPIKMTALDAELKRHFRFLADTQDSPAPP
jgi:signal transduction histidine kinase/ActR/RegA family two-component response regulator